MYSNWALRSGWCESLARLAVGLQAVPRRRAAAWPPSAARRDDPARSAPRPNAGCSCRSNGAETRGRHESRVPPTTPAPPATPGPSSVTGRRPAPGPTHPHSPAPHVAASVRSSSRNPAVIVGRDSPVARATSDTPPQPSSRASAAAHCRRLRSSIRGPALIIPLNPSEVLGIPHARSSQIQPYSSRPICKGYFCASPNLKASVMRYWTSSRILIKARSTQEKSVAVAGRLTGDRTGAKNVTSRI